MTNPPFDRQRSQPMVSPTRRPGITTAAAVLAFVEGGLGILGNLISFRLLSLLGGGYAILLVIGLILAGLMIWGGTQAIQGKDGRPLVVITIAEIVFGVIGLIIQGTPIGIIGLIVPILILIFMLNMQSKNWLRSQGGQTF